MIFISFVARLLAGVNLTWFERADWPDHAIDYIGGWGQETRGELE